MTPVVLVTEHVASRHGTALDAAAPGHARVVVRPDGAIDGDPAAVDVAFFSGDAYPGLTREVALAMRAATGLRWVHTFSAGVDNVWFQRMLADGIRITTSSGAAAVPIAQTVALYLLALSRDLPAWLDAQRRHAWEPHPIADLEGRVLGLVGLGPIGLEVARLGLALRMRVIGLRRTPTGEEPCETWPLDRLDDLLDVVDDLVLALPLTPQTRHLLDGAALARLRPGCRIVNVGRGELVDEDALVAALRDSRLAGAGLDVFAVEPLPAESPLWDLPNVIVTPHSSGTSPGNDERAAGLFVENLRRYVRGEPLRNEVVSAS